MFLKVYICFKKRAAIQLAPGILLSYVSACAYNYFCTYDLYSPMRNVLDVCISITRGSGRGLGPGIQEFLGPVKWHRADRRVPFGSQKT
jgi:hypothetical protein